MKRYIIILIVLLLVAPAAFALNGGLLMPTGPHPAFRTLHVDNLGSDGALNLGVGENTRVARAMYYDSDADIFKYAETPLTASENQLVSNSDFSARSYGYDVIAPGFDGSTWTEGANWVEHDGYASIDNTGGGNSSLSYDVGYNYSQIGYHFRILVTVDVTTLGSGLRLFAGGTAYYEVTASGSYDIIVTATNESSGIYISARADFVGSISDYSIQRVSLSEANSRMTGTGSDVLDGDGAFDTDTTGDWGQNNATLSYESSDFMRATSTTDSLQWGAIRTSFLTADQRYYITFKAKSSVSAAFASVGDAGDVGNAVSNPALTTSWQDYAFYITPTGTSLRLYLAAGTASIGSTLDFDDIVVKPVEHDWEPATTGMVFDVDDTSAGKLYFVGDDSVDGDKVKLTAVYTVGHYYRVSVKAKVVSGTPAPVRLGQVFASDNDYNFSFTPTTSEETYTGYIVCYDGNFYLGNNGTGLDGVVMEFDDLVIEEVTLDDWAVNGTIDADNYFIYDENNTVRIVALNQLFGLLQDIGDLNDHVQYTLTCSVRTSGDAKIDLLSTSPTIDSVGSISGIDQITDASGRIVLRRNSYPSDITLSSFTAYPVPQTQAFEDGWALFGAQAKNSVLDSRGSAWEDSASWTDFASPTYGTLVSGFDGTVNAVPITDSNASGFSGPYQFITVDDADQTHTVCVFIKKDEDETRFPELSLQLSGGTNITQAVQINTKTGAYTARIGTTSYATVQSYGDFWRLCTTITNEAAKNNTQLAVDLKVARGKTLGGFDQDAIGTTTFDQVDVYLNTSGWIPNPRITESSEVTQDADLARWEMSADFKALFSSDGTMVFKWKPGFAAADHPSSDEGIVSVADAASGLVYLNEDDIKSNDGTTTIVAAAAAYASGTEYLVALKWDADGNFYIAIEPLSSTFDADSWKAFDSFDGAFTLGTYLNLFYSGWGKMWMRDLRVYDSILTDDQLNARRTH
jgi:hypothetical protein